MEEWIQVILFFLTCQRSFMELYKKQSWQVALTAYNTFEDCFYYRVKHKISHTLQQVS